MRTDYNKLISFVIINFNCHQLIVNLIHQIKNSCNYNNYEIVIVDNSVNKEEKKFFQKNSDDLIDQYICLDQNVGFGQACNIGARAARGNILVFINPDVEISKQGFDDFIYKNIDNNNCFSPLILNTDGTLQPNCNSYSNIFVFIISSLKISKLIDRFKLKKIILNFLKFLNCKNNFIFNYFMNFEIQKRKICDWISGACMILSRKLFFAVKGFDANFFMYLEDEDLCRRIKKYSDCSIFVESSFFIVHHVSTTYKESSIQKFVLAQRFVSNLYYIKKYDGNFCYYLLKTYYLLYFLVLMLINLILLQKKIFDKNLFILKKILRKC